MVDNPQSDGVLRFVVKRCWCVVSAIWDTLSLSISPRTDIRYWLTIGTRSGQQH